MRSHGQVRFITLSSRVQIAAVGALAFLLAAWLVTMASLTASQWSAQSERLALQQREAQVASAESRVQQYRAGIGNVAEDLARRQQFIEQVVEAHIADLPENAPADGAAQGQGQAQAQAQAKTEKVSAALPEASALQRIEAQQLAFVERLTRYADSRAASATEAIRKLGLNPNAIAASARGGQGGPLQKLVTARDGSLDQRFARLGSSLARMNALEDGLASIPQVSPAHVAYVSSSYGYRADPFTGGAAFHAGLDFPGPMGSPIYAAAKGTVSFVGQKQGYGNCIEVTHGNGLMTRYAHLSRFGARVGQKVDAGTVIGGMGSTGRSTGSHLHFEVRVNGQAVNPRPFLEAARNVQQEAR